MLNNPAVRVAARAVLAGVGAAVGILQSGGTWQNALYAGVLMALSFAGLETATPLNKTVGIGKG